MHSGNYVSGNCQSNEKYDLKELNRICYIGILICGFLIVSYAINSIFAYGAFAIVFLMIFNPKDYNDTMIPFFIIVSWGSEIWSSIGMTAYTILRIATIGMYLWRCVKKGKLGRYTFWCSLLLFALYVIVGDMLNGGYYIKQIFNLVISYSIIYLVCRNALNFHFEKYAVSFSTGVILSAIIFYIAPYIPKLNTVVSSIIQTYNVYGVNKLERLSGLTYDPNLFGLYVIVSICVLLRVLFIYKFKYKMGLFLTVVLCALGILTLSKTFILVFSFLVILFFHSWMNTRDISIAKKIFFLSAMILVGCLLLSQMDVYLEAIMERLTVGSSSEFTTGRSDIWKHYISTLLNDPIMIFFGHSLSGRLYGYSTPHNYIIYMIFYFGIIGCILHGVMLYNIYKQVRENNRFMYLIRVEKFSTVPLLMYFVYIMALDPFMLYDIKMVTLLLLFLSFRRLEHRNG